MTKAGVLRILTHVAALALGVIFLLAGFAKTADLDAFQQSIREIGGLPMWFVGMAVLSVPGLELTLGVCLLIGFARKETALLAMGLLLMFLAFGIYSNVTGHSAACGCFGIATPTWLRVAGWSIVVRNLGILALGAVVLLGAAISPDPKGLDGT